MKTSRIRIGTGLLVTSLLGTAMTLPQAAYSKVSAKTTTHTMTGSVVSVSGKALTVRKYGNKLAPDTTVTVPSTASVMMGHKSTPLSGLKQGQTVTVKIVNGTVTSVLVHPGSLTHLRSKSDQEKKMEAEKKAHQKPVVKKPAVKATPTKKP